MVTPASGWKIRKSLRKGIVSSLVDIFPNCSVKHHAGKVK